MKKLMCWMFVALLCLPSVAIWAEEPRSMAEGQGNTAVSKDGPWTAWLRWGIDLFERMTNAGEHGPLIDPNGHSSRARVDVSDATLRDPALGRGGSVPAEFGTLVGASEHGPLIDPNGAAAR